MTYRPSSLGQTLLTAKFDHPTVRFTSGNQKRRSSTL
jgi:hypothetical protein